VCINIFKRSPLQLSAPLIDFYLALALMPVVLVGQWVDSCAICCLQ
jgi:hypothetical protein